MTLDIDVEEKKNAIILRLTGRLDAFSSAVLEKKFSQLLEKKIKTILVDFSDVDYLSSAGMRLLLSATKQMKEIKGKVVLFALQDDVLEIIRMAGFERILSIATDEKSALEASS